MRACRTVRSTHQLAILPVGNAKQRIIDEGYSIEIKHKPIDKAPSHSGIFYLVHAPEIIADILGQEVSDFHEIE